MALALVDGPALRQPKLTMNSLTTVAGLDVNRGLGQSPGWAGATGPAASQPVGHLFLSPLQFAHALASGSSQTSGGRLQIDPRMMGPS
jgi:hypothetical protein